MASEIKSENFLYGWIESYIGGRDENQDCAGALSTEYGTIVVVCDGMGGMSGGSLASSIAVRTIVDDFNLAGSSIVNPELFLKETISHANDVIRKEQQEDEVLSQMGTTVACAIFTNECATLAHMGDSRIYQFRGGEKIYRTADHSVVFERVKNKLISEEEARCAPDSNLITRALGAFKEVEVDIVSLSYEKGDRFLICTDGFWGAMKEKSFVNEIASRGDVHRILLSTALKIDRIGRKRFKGNHDNLTAALIELNVDSNKKSFMRRKDRIIFCVLCAILLISFVLNIVLLCRNDHSDLCNPVAISIQKDSASIQMDSASIQKDSASIQMDSASFMKQNQFNDAKQ